MNSISTRPKASAELRATRCHWQTVFSENNIRYSIIRDEQEAFSGEALEVDVLLHPADLTAVKCLLLERGYVLRSKFSNFPHFPFYLYGSKGPVFILDVVTEIRVGGNGCIWSLGDSDMFIRQSALLSGFSVLDQDQKFACGLLHEILDKGEIRDKWRKQLSVNSERLEGVERVLATMLGSPSLAAGLRTRLACRDFAAIQAMVPAIQFRLLLANGVSGIYSVLKYILTRGWEWRWLRGPRFISLVGIDGAGKSTIISRLCDKEPLGRTVLQCRLGHGATRRYYFPLTTVVCPVSDNIRDETLALLSNEPGRWLSKIVVDVWAVFSRVGFVRRALRVMLVPLLFWLEDIMSLHEQAKGRGRKFVIVTDRHLIDGLVHDLWSRGSIRWFPKLLYHHLFRRPHLMVLMSCSGELAYARKQEMDPFEGDRLNQSYKNHLLESYWRPQFWLDSTLPVEEQVDKLQIVLNTLE